MLPECLFPTSQSILREQLRSIKSQPVTRLIPSFYFYLFHAAIVVATFFDRSPFSPNVSARVHGRVQVTIILLKGLLTLLYTQSDWVSPWVLIVPSLFAGLTWVVMYWMYLPFYKQWVNSL